MRDDLQTRLSDPRLFPGAYEDLKQHLRVNRTLKEYQFGHRMLQSLVEDPVRRPFAREVRLAVLTSYTIDFLMPLLKTDLMLDDIGGEIYKPHFNQFRQEVLDPDSGLYRFCPDMTFVGFGLEDVTEDPLELYDTIARAFRANAPPKSILLLQDLVVPHDAFDSLVRTGGSTRARVDQINSALRDVASRYANTYVMEYSRVVHDCGWRTWADPRTYYTARIPVAQQNWLPLSEAYARYVRALMNLEIKCIVLDLDNTLWGGVLGEDGFDGIQIGETYPGIVFKRFQEYLRGLYSSGYILAISSKNDADDVLQVLRQHPAMVLKEEHFAAIKANWRPKENNIQEISAEIQITSDHMLFIDDNLVEIEKVKSALPGIRCMHIDSPPINFVRQLEDQRCIGKILITDEDRLRGQQYSDDRKRREFRHAAGTIEDFYNSLGQRLTIHVNNLNHRARIAQLSQRTNQFNMTTFRLTESAVEEMMKQSGYCLITADLTDRFGNSGTIGYVQIRQLDRSWIIENFLMSCRVLGRTVEQGLLQHIMERARAGRVECVLADYIPTRKNEPFAAFYPANGFAEIENNANGSNGKKRYMRRPADPSTRAIYVDVAEAQSVAGGLNAG